MTLLHHAAVSRQENFFIRVPHMGILNRVFTKAWELLRTQTLLEEKYKGIQLPTEIPTILALDEKLDARENDTYPTAKPIDSQELALLQNLFAMMLKNRESTVSIRLKDFLAMAGAGPVNRKTDVGSALGLLSRLGRLYYQPEGRPGELPAGTFYSVVMLSSLEEDEDGGTIELYSWYAKKLLEADPDVDPDKYLPIPEDRITDRTRAA